MATRRLSYAVKAVVVTSAVATAVALVPATGNAAPTPTISQVEAQVSHLQHEAEVAAEHFNGVRIQIQQAQQHLRRVKGQLTREQANADKAQQTMGAYAAATYTTGGIDPTLQLVLAPDPSAFLAQAASLDQVARIQDSAFRQARVAHLRLTQAQDAVNQQLDQLAALKKQAAAAKADIAAKMREAQHLLSTLKAQQRARLAAQQARRAAAAAAASRAAVRAAAPSSSGGSSSSYAPAPNVSGRAGIAVAYARSKVGLPYVFAAAGPGAYDCSGLTSAAWAAAGVYLPHYAPSQYAMTTHISLSQIQPGDLLFFYPGIEHVGIYIGGGYMVHAANPSEGVRVDYVLSGYWPSVLVGVGRV